MAPPGIHPRQLLPKVESKPSTVSPPLDSFPDSDDAPNKRRCISNACMPCRKRKSKCDGAKPSCNACIAVYKTHCHYDLDSDHRRKGALKRDIRQLKEENNKQDIIIDAIRRGPDTNIHDIVQLVRANPEEPLELVVENIKKMSLNPGKKPEPPSLEGEIVGFSGKPALNKSSDTRHYGYTSNLALVGPENDDLPAMATNQSGTWTGVTDDNELIEHLLSLYFAWSHPLYMLFSEEVFYHGLNDKKLKYCTPMLFNAILALACNFSDRPEARQDPNDPSTVGDHFFAEAKRLFIQDERSCLTTIQALGVMSLRQAMNNHDSSGWKYAGQMINMAVELGLHMTYKVQPNGKVTATEIEARRITFWGCYVLETAWCVCVGRVSSLPRTAIKLDKPCLRDNLEMKTWKAHGVPSHSRELTILEQPSFTYNLLVQLSSLSEIVNDTIHMFYAPSGRITSPKLQQHYERFESWYKELPTVLNIKRDVPTLPQVIALHAYYHNCVLHLFRPFLRLSFVENLKTPRQICSDAAFAICNLMRLHSQWYGLRHVLFLTTHCIMSSAIIHLVNTSGENATNPLTGVATDYLAESIQMLHQMYPSFPLVARYLKAIRTIVSQRATVVPQIVLTALDASELPFLVPLDGSPGTSPPLPSSTDLDIDAPCSPTVDACCDHKQSAPETIQMTPPNVHERIGDASPPPPGSFSFRAPFPDSMDSIPVQPLESSLNTNLEVGAIFDSGTGWDWEQLNRDGFVVEDRDVTRALWGI